MKWFFLLCLVFSNPVHAADPSWKYQVLRSPNFEIIFRDTQKDLAKRYILAAEQAHELLMPIFKEGPAKTIIYLRDDTDSSNGLANFLPFPHITVYPVLPNSLDSVDEYGDWPFEMMLHEYTHILNMYPAHGIYVPLKWIFGTVVRPNAVLPRWWLEGLAVNLESWLSDHGRLRSTETAASARALAIGGKFKLEDVARINEAGLNAWPYGGRPYLFGAWWWDEVHRQKGTSVIETWNQNYSRRLPFFLQGPVMEQVQKTPGEFLGMTLTKLDTEGRRQIAMIEKSGDHKSVPVAEDKGEQSAFAISPSGDKMVYWLSQPHSGTAARLKVRTGEANQPFTEIASRRLFKAVGTTRIRWIDDSRFLFDQIDISYPYATYRDLYIYDLNKNEKIRLTEQERAQEGAPSPSGQTIAYIQNDGGKNRLNLFDLNTKKSRTLISGNMNQRLSWPEFLSENQILFAVRQKKGQEQLHVYDLSTKKTRIWNTQLKSAQNPRLTQEGLLVTDASTNARNVYLIKDGQSKAVTNTLTDIQVSDFDPRRKEIVISELTPEGRRLRALPLAEFQPPRLPTAKWEPAPKPTTTKVKLQEESYIPVAYLWPRYWIPFIYQVEDGFIFQGLTANQDPAARNQYTLFGSYDTVTKKPSYGASYINSSLPTDIGLNYAKSISYLGASGLTVESENAGLSFAQHWPFNSRFNKWALGGIYSDTQRETSTRRVQYKRMGPEISWQYSRLNNPLNERWGFHLELAHQEYLKQNDYIDYGRSYAHLATQLTLGAGHRISFQGRGAVAPELPMGTILTLGDRNVGGNYLINLANSDFLLRGYPSGTFVGRKVVNANLEYAFPAVDLNKGFGTFPVYLRNLEFALFADTMAVDGAGWDVDRAGYYQSRLSENYMGAGGELRFNTTSLYHLPLSLTIGLYYGFNERFGGGLSPFFGFGFGGLNPLENKTP